MLYIANILTINYELIMQESLYLGLLMLLLAASFGLPLPEDIPLLIAGCLCRLGYGRPIYVILTGLLGVLSGDIILYHIGRKYGRGVLDIWPLSSLFTKSHIERMEELFRRYGNFIVFFGRFFAGIRSVMCVTAGMMKVPRWKFIVLDMSGASVTVPLLVGLGWVFSDKISKLIKGVIAFEHITVGLIATIMVLWIISIHLNKKSHIKQIEMALEEESEEKNQKEGKKTYG